MGMAEIGIRVFLEDAASSGLRAIDAAMSGMLGVALGAVGGLLLFGGALAYSVKAAADFQTAMFGVAVATHVPMATAMQYAGVLMNLAATSTYSSDQIAQGIALLGRSGYSIGQIFNVAKGQTESMAQAAIALGIATRSTATEAFGLMAQVMSAYTLKATEAAHVSDLLQFGFEHQRGSIAEFAQGLSQVTGLAGQLHVPLREVVAALDVMGPAMRSSAAAGTALRYMLAGLYQPSDAAKTEMIALGLGASDAGGKFHSAFYDAQGRALDFDSAVHLLSDHLKGLTDEQRLAALKALFSVRGGQGANSLLENLSKLDAYLKQLQESSDNAGGAMRRWNEVMQTLQGAWAGFTSSVRDMAIVIGLALIPALTNFLNFANGVISQVRTWALANQQAAASFLGIATALSAITLLVILFIAGILEIVGIILLTVAAIALLAAGIVALIGAIQQGISAQNAMGAILRALGAAFSALGTLIHGTVIPALQALAAWLGPRIGAAFSSLGHVMNDVVAPAIVSMAGWLQTRLGPAFSALGSWISGTVIPALQQLGSWLGPRLGVAFSTLGTWIYGTAIPALQQLRIWLGATFSSLGTWISGVAIPALQRFGEWIGPRLGAAFSTLGTWIHVTAIPALQQLGTWVGPRLGTAFSNLGHIIHDIILPAIGNLASGLQTHLGPAFSALGTFIQSKVVPALQSLWSWLVVHVGAAFSSLGRIMQTQVVPALQGIWKWIQSDVVPAIQNLWHWAGTVLGPAFSTLGATVHDRLLPALQGLWHVIQTQILPTLQEFALWVKAHILPALQALASLILGPIVTGLQTLWHWLQQNSTVLKILAVIIAGPVVLAFVGLTLILAFIVLAIALVLAILAGLITVLTKVIEIVHQTSSAIGTFVHDTIQKVTEWGTTIGTAIGRVIKWFQDLPGLVQGAIQQFVDMVLQKLREMVRQVVGQSIIPDMIKAIAQWFGNLPGMIVGALATFVSTVVTGMQTAFSRGLAAVVTGVSNIVSQVSTLPGKIGGALAGLAGSMFTWGANAMGSFANGLGSMLGAVISQVQAAAGAVANFLAHSSPAKEGPLAHDDEWMPNMMRMLAKGVQEGAPQLKLAFGSAVSGMASVAPVVGYSGTGVGTTTINLMLDGKVLGQVVMNRLTGQLQSNGLGRAFK